jgi:EAL domain-containing protein (putative c-di-GMP-specific phosphodiesterase class I)
MATPRRGTLIKNITESGIEPLTTLISPVRRCVSREVYAFRTIRQVNSLQLGVLRPVQYRNVCDRTLQSIGLAISDLRSVIRLSQKLDADEVQYDWITTYIPIKLLQRKDAAAKLEEALQKEGLSNPSKICLEFLSDALFDDLDRISAALRDFKALGFKTAITAYGDEFCPVSRLFGLPVDVCMFIPSVSQKAETPSGNRLASQLTAFVRSNDCEPVVCVAGKMPSAAKPDVYAKAGFSGFTSFEDDDGEWLTYEDFRARQTEGL